MFPRRTLMAAVVVGAALAGCRSGAPADPQPSGRTPTAGEVRTAKGGSPRLPPISGSAPTNAPPVTVLLPASGRIHAVNQGLRFVVVDYTLGGAPALQSRLSVFRAGQKVGELRLSGPERNGFVAADVIEGFVQIDDEVRLE